MSQSPLRVEGNNMHSKTLLLFVCFCFLVVFMTIATAVSGVVAQPTLPRRRLSHHYSHDLTLTCLDLPLISH